MVSIFFLIIACILLGLIVAVAAYFVNKVKQFDHKVDTKLVDYEDNSEQIVCRDVTEIYCNTISYLNQLCSINGQIEKSVERLISYVSLNKAMETHQLKSLEDEIDFRLHEVGNISLPSFEFSTDTRGKAILAKHNLSVLEIASAETCVKQSVNDLVENFDYLKQQLKANQDNLLGIHFAQTRFKAFHYECNALYYGALEGICSFPIESLRLYYEMAPQWDCMPKGITLQSLNKEGFKMKQELEFQKAQQCLDSASVFIDNYGNDVDIVIKGLKRREVNFFIAGSKSLQRERDVFAGVVNILQSQWKPLGIDVNSFSCQNFPRDVSVGGHQEQYNHFIANHVRVSVFILRGKAGEYTMEEFNVAYENFKKNRTPKIFVYSLNDGNNKCDTQIHAKMEEEKQYWIEYRSVDELRLLLERDLNSYLIGEYSSLTTALQ